MSRGTFGVAVATVLAAAALAGCAENAPAGKDLSDVSTPMVGAALASPPAALLQGYDSVGGMGLSTAIRGVDTQTGGDSGANISVCTDLSQLDTALNIDQSLTASFAGFGSVEQKLNFVSSLHFTSNSTSIVVYARHVASTHNATNVALNDGVKVPSDPASARAFFRGYGDSYVSSITLGGEYYAVYTFYSESKEEKKSLDARLSADGIASGLSVNVDVKVKLDNFLKSEKTRSTFEQRISGIGNPQLPREDEAANFALSFPSQYLDAPTVIDFQTTGYERVPGIGDGLDAVANNRDLFIGSIDDKGLVGQLGEVVQLTNGIADIQATYKAYGGFQDGGLDRVKTEAKKDMDGMTAAIRAYERDPTRPIVAPAFSSTSHGTPALNIVLNQTGEHGGYQDSPFDDISAAAKTPLAFVSNRIQIRSIQINGGQRVDHLAVTYVDSENREQTMKHGWSDGGNAQGPLYFSDGEFISGLSGGQGNTLDRLFVSTSKGQTTGDGGGGGAPFSEPLNRPPVPIAFRGRSGAHLTRVMLVTLSFLPATWEPNAQQ